METILIVAMLCVTIVGWVAVIVAVWINEERKDLL